jgi:hypothetical protein
MKIIIKAGVFGSLLMLSILTFKYFTFSTAIEKEDNHYQKYVNQHYKVFALEIPDSLMFLGEEVPLEMEDIKERYDRELLVNAYWQSQTLLFYKRAHKFFPIIEPILKENDIPDDFKYLALAESGLTNVVSPAGAAGYWQFLKKTGQEYDLEVNDEVDERYNIEKSTKAFCHYMKDSYEYFGNWTLAAASYNVGIAGLQKQITRQNVSNYYDLLLNEETGRYIFRLIAIREIISNPTKYGFYFRPQDLYPVEEYKIVELNKPVKDFAIYAQEQGINYKILKVLNPWLRQSYLSNPNGKTYQIKIPTSGYYSISSSDSLSYN